MTFSEFGRRVQENGSRGTDHGAASCLFVAGPSVKGGVVGKHPSLADLDAGDLKFHTDFRRVYATLLDGWLGCDSKAVLGAKWDHVKDSSPGPEEIGLVKPGPHRSAAVQGLPSRSRSRRQARTAAGERLASTIVGDVSLSSEPTVALRAPVRHAGATSPTTPKHFRRHRY